MMRKKGFFASHAKSSAALVSLGIHAVLIVIALSFVAVTVITKEEKAFEAKPVKRPKMSLKKLQVPVNIKKKPTKKPKLRKRIVVQPKMNSTMPDIKMPEITGVKGGLESSGLVKFKVAQQCNYMQYIELALFKEFYEVIKMDLVCAEYGARIQSNRALSEGVYGQKFSRSNAADYSRQLVSRIRQRHVDS
jgi:hypothetical protein